MAHSTDADMDASFLAVCIHKSKSVLDVPEILGLFSTVHGPRKDLDFPVEGANDMYGEIKRIAKAFSSSYTNGKEQLQADLAKKTTFASEAQRLGQLYGAKIWGQSKDSQEGVSKGIFFRWSRESDRERILFYIRCWIITLTMKDFGTTPRKPRRKSLARQVAPLDDEQTTSDSSSLSDRPFVPTAQMLPPSTHGTVRPTVESWKESAAARMNSYLNVNQDATIVALHDKSGKHADQTTPSKRKVIDIDERTSNRKLPKICKIVRSNKEPTPRQERDYSIPMSPTVVANRVVETFPQQRVRESSCATDRTWRPRDGTPETEEVDDAAEILDLRLEALIQSNIFNSERDQLSRRHGIDETIAGPSGTYRNPLRQDSVIPGDTQPSTQRAVSEPIEGTLNRPNAITHDPIDNVQIFSRSMNRASFEGTGEKRHRTELFKLLVSHLNGIKQFDPDTYSMEAEDQMNMLLDQFRINDVEMLQAKLGVEFIRLDVALDSWMTMRYRLTKFRIATGYLGRPGEEWSEYLKHMSNVPCAHATLSYVDLKESAMKDGELSYVVETFDEDLAKIFDLLTMIQGCNGPEAFKGIRSYNAALLDWFK